MSYGRVNAVEGVNRLSAKMRRDELKAESCREVAKALRESLAEDDGAVTKGAAPGDKRKMRGVPILARGVESTMSGTNPQRETIRRLSK